MKNIKTLLAATAVALASVSAANAQTVSTVAGQTDPSPINVSGNITKYVEFTKDETYINMRGMGGAPFTGYWESDAPAAGAGTLADPKGSGDANQNYAEVVFKANTHISVSILNGTEFTSTGSGVHQDNLLPTMFRIKVKGGEVRTDTLNGAIIPGTAAGYVDRGLSNASVTGSPVSSTYVFGNGVGNGIRISALAQRQGLNDHHGVYATGITTVTWADLQ